MQSGVRRKLCKYFSLHKAPSRRLRSEKKRLRNGKVPDMALLAPRARIIIFYGPGRSRWAQILTNFRHPFLFPHKMSPLTVSTKETERLKIFCSSNFLLRLNFPHTQTHSPVSVFGWVGANWGWYFFIDFSGWVTLAPPCSFKSQFHCRPKDKNFSRSHAHPQEP